MVNDSYLKTRLNLFFMHIIYIKCLHTFIYLGLIYFLEIENSNTILSFHHLAVAPLVMYKPLMHGYKITRPALTSLLIRLSTMSTCDLVFIQNNCEHILFLTNIQYALLLHNS